MDGGEGEKNYFCGNIDPESFSAIACQSDPVPQLRKQLGHFFFGLAIIQSHFSSLFDIYFIKFQCLFYR